MNKGKCLFFHCPVNRDVFEIDNVKDATSLGTVGQRDVEESCGWEHTKGMEVWMHVHTLLWLSKQQLGTNHDSCARGCLCAGHPHTASHPSPQGSSTADSVPTNFRRANSTPVCMPTARPGYWTNLLLLGMLLFGVSKLLLLGVLFPSHCSWR